MTGKRWRRSEIQALYKDDYDVRCELFSNNLGIVAIKLTFLETGKVRAFQRVENWFVEDS